MASKSLPIELVDRVLDLSEEQRIELADQIYMSLETFPFATTEVQEAWNLEIQNRIERANNGELKNIPAETVLSDLKEQQRARSES